MLQRVHMLGASGCGVTTLGRAVATAMAWPYYDTDDFYWLPTDPPYRLKRDPNDRLSRLLDVILTSERWVLGGALDGWGDALITRFDLVVYLEATTEVRLQRLRQRERARFGARIEPGGDMHVHHLRFLDWARAYDTAKISGMRSRARHVAWLAQLEQPVLRLDAALSTDELTQSVQQALGRR